MSRPKMGFQEQAVKNLEKQWINNISEDYESAFVLLKMSSSFLTCPLCSQPGFQTLDSLRYGLISAATRQVVCPVCHDILFGLDKFTIHLFSHSIQCQHEANSGSVPIEISFRSATAPLNQQSSSSTLTNNLLVYSKADFNSNMKDMKECRNSNNQTNLSPSVSQKPLLGSTGCWSKEMIIEGKIRMENLNDKQSCKIISDTNEATKNYVPEKSEINAVWEEKSHNNKVDCKYTITSQSSNVALLEYTQNNSELIEVQTATKSSQTISECQQRSHIDKIANVSSSLGSKSFHPQNQYSSRNISETTHQNASVHSLVSSSALSQENSIQAVPTEKGLKGVVRCDICGFAFEDSSILAIHHQLVHCMESRSATPSHRIEVSDGCKQGHTLGEKHQFPCHLCSKAFKMRGSLMVHLRVAHSSGIVAGKSFIRKVDSDSPSEERKFSCHICAKSFKKEQHLQQHMKTHEGKQWECDVCSKLFTTKYFLKKHKRLHTGETPYSCDTCGKTFTFQQSYHKHLLYHSDDKPHVCMECDRAFKELSTLHNHQRIHTGEKPFACETCGKCFRQRVSYLVHRRIHTGVMPYRCTACDKSFRYKVSQRTHKCPSQPPGIVVRQSSDLVQKLLQGAQQKVAPGSSQMLPAHTIANNDDRVRNGETQQPQPLSFLRPSDESHIFPIPQQQNQHQQFNDSQFTIIVGNDVQSLFPTAQILLASGSLYGGPSTSTHVVHSNSNQNSKIKQASDTHKMEEEIWSLNKKKNFQNLTNPAVIGAVMTTPDLNTDKQETKEDKCMIEDGNNNFDVGKMKNTTDCNPAVSSLNVGGSQQEFSHQSNNTNSLLTTGNKLAQNLASSQGSDFQLSAEDELQISTCGSTDFCKSSNKRCKSIENLDLVVETTDFFTMIMSPSVKSLHSPSEKLRHLTLSSPVDTLLGSEDDGMLQFLMNTADTAEPTNQDKSTDITAAELLKSTSKTAQMEEPGMKPLQTINQESLRQLLYGTPGS